MKYYALSFKIPNAYGSYLADILEPISINEYKWLIDNDEIHLLDNNEFTNEFLFKEEEREVQGERLYSLAKAKTYYLIFVTLRAFYFDSNIESVRTFTEFMESDCQIGLSVSDCAYVMIWCKNSELLTKIYDYAIAKGYEDAEFISEEDLTNKNYYLE